MFKKNDKSFNMIVKITNVVLFVLMCVSVLIGIVMIALSFKADDFYGIYVNFGTLFGGIAAIILGPILIQFIWLLFDMAFNAILDVKLIRNAEYKNQTSAQELPAPIFRKGTKEKEGDKYEAYKKLKEYKELLDETVITKDEYDLIKAELMSSVEEKTDSTINQVKELKKLADEKIITEQEFVNEKAKILKK